jgi:hypothetical protein
MVCGRPSVGDSCVDTATGTAARTRGRDHIAAVAAERARCRADGRGSALGSTRPLDYFLVNGGVGPLREVYHGTCPGVPIPSAKGLLQGSECHFTGAVAWGHASELPLVTQRSYQTVDLGF